MVAEGLGLVARVIIAMDQDMLGVAAFATHRGLTVRGAGLLALSRGSVAALEFDDLFSDVAPHHQEDVNVREVVFRRAAHHPSEGAVDLVGVVRPRADALGRDGFYGACVCLPGGRPELYAAAVDVASQIVSEQDPADEPHLPKATRSAYPNDDAHPQYQDIEALSTSSGALFLHWPHSGADPDSCAYRGHVLRLVASVEDNQAREVVIFSTPEPRSRPADSEFLLTCIITKLDEIVSFEEETRAYFQDQLDQKVKQVEDDWTAKQQSLVNENIALRKELDESRRERTSQVRPRMAEQPMIAERTGDRQEWLHAPRRRVSRRHDRDEDDTVLADLLNLIKDIAAPIAIVSVIALIVVLSISLADIVFGTSLGKWFPWR